MRAQVVVIGGGAFGASCFYHLTGRGVTGRGAPRAGDARLGLDGAVRRGRRDAVPRPGPGRPLRVVHPGVPVARARARAPVRPPRVSPARPLGGGRGRLPRERRPPAGARAPRRARDRARRGRAHRAGPPRGRSGGRSVGLVGRLRRRRALLRAALRSRAGRGRPRAPGPARHRPPAPGRPRHGRGVRRRGDRVRDGGQCQRRVGSPARRRARADAARRRLSAPAGPVRAARGPSRRPSRW